MKIISWNINSLRSTEHGFLDLLKREKPDVVCLQETRCDLDQLSMFLREIPGYEFFLNPSGKRGYGGTAVYYNEEMNVDEVSNLSGVLGEEGRSILLRLGKTLIFNFYVPNGNSGSERLEYKMRFHRAMSSFIEEKLSLGYSVIVAADLNVVHKDKDSYHNKAISASGFLPQERSWMDSFLEIGFQDSFRINNEEGGYYTWWHMRDPKRTQNKGIRFDYFLVSDDLCDDISRSDILKDVFGSDHCPILLET